MIDAENLTLALVEAEVVMLATHVPSVYYVGRYTH